MKRIAGVVIATAWASSAFADPDPNAAPPIPAKPAPGPIYHDGQVGISIRTGIGLRGIATYSDKDYCGSTDTSSSTGNAPVCIGRAPMSLDLEMSYGIGKKVDLLVEMGLGLETDFGSGSTTDNGPHQVRLSPGLRYFFSEAETTKLFATAQAVFDFSDYKDITGASRGNDFGLRNLNGIWFDLHRAFGVYVYAGETLSFARWLDLELEIGVGVQGRFPN